MTKYVINTVEVVKRVYLADGYTEEEALKKQKVQSLNNAAEKVVELGELLYSIESINSYEYQKDWVDETKSIEISEGQGTLLDPDRLKGPTLNEIR